MSRPLVLVSGWFLLTIGAVASAPLAQDDAMQGDEPVRLGETVIEAQGQSTTTPTFEFAEERLTQVPGGASILSADDFQLAGAINQEDAFKRIPGVWVTNVNGADDAFVSIRGSNLSNRSFSRGNSHFLDGFIPLHRLDGGSHVDQLINLRALDYLEVYRGGNALELGVSTLGGAINYVLPTGYTADRLLVGTEFGSDDLWRTQLSTGAPTENGDYYVSVDTTHYDGFRDQSIYSAYRLATSYAIRLDDQTESRFYLFGSRSRAELPGSLPKDQAEDDPSDAAFFNNIVDTDRNFTDLKAANKTTWVDGAQTIDLGAYASWINLDHLPTPFVGIVDDDNYELGVNGRYRNIVDLIGDDNEITVGLRYSYLFGENQRHRYTDAGEDEGLTVFDSDIKANLVEAYAQDRVPLGQDWHLIGGVQLVYTDRDLEDNAIDASPAPVPPFPPQPSAIAGDQSYDENYFEVNPRVGATYDLTDDVLLFGNVSRSSSFPSFTEINDRLAFGLDTDLDAQKGWTFELGTRGSTGPTPVAWWDVTYFYSLVKDDLLFQEGPFPNTTFVENFDTLHQGIETGFGTDLLQLATGERTDHNLSLTGVLNWFDFQFDDDETFGDNELPGIPEFPLYSSLDYAHVAGFYAGANVRWVDDYGLTLDETGGDAFDIDAYAVVGATTGYRFGNGITLYTALDNLADEEYLSTGSITTTSTPGSFANVTPGDGMTWLFGLQYALN